MGNSLQKPVNSIQVEFNKNKLTYSAYSTVNGYRINNEDSHVLSHEENEYIFNGVFDGHGGDVCSKYMSSYLPQCIFKDCSEITNEHIIQKCIELDKKFLAENTSTSGSTGTFSIIKKEGNIYKTFICNIGDSMTILLKKTHNGYEEIFATIEHKPYLAEEKIRIERDGGFVNADRVMGQLAVSRAFGDINYKTNETYENNKVIAIPDVNLFNCEEGDILVHICDGITESNFDLDLVCDYIKNNINKYSDLRVLTSLMCLEALQNGSKDNLSCMIIKFQQNDVIEKHQDFIPGPLYMMGYENMYYNAYKSACEKINLNICDVLMKRLQFITNYENNHTYETELEQVLLKHHFIETEEDFEAEKNLINKIIGNILVQNQ